MHSRAGAKDDVDVIEPNEGHSFFDGGVRDAEDSDAELDREIHGSETLPQPVDKSELNQVQLYHTPSAR